MLLQENLIHTYPTPFQQERLEFPQGGGGGIFAKPNSLKMKCVKITVLEVWAFGVEGGAGSKKNLFLGGVWIFSEKFYTLHVFPSLAPFPSLLSLEPLCFQSAKTKHPVLCIKSKPVFFAYTYSRVCFLFFSCFQLNIQSVSVKCLCCF